jgi:hypothetical protein
VPVVDATNRSAISGLELKRELPLEIGNYGSENKVISFPSPFYDFPICVDLKSSNIPLTERVALGRPPGGRFQLNLCTCLHDPISGALIEALHSDACIIRKSIHGGRCSYYHTIPRILSGTGRSVIGLWTKCRHISR